MIKDKKINIKTIISTLWIFILFNIIFRDLHEFISPGFLEEALKGYVNGQKITEGLLALGVLVVEIPVAMVLLSRVLKNKINRWINMITSAVCIPLIITGVTDLDDIIFATIEILALLAIICIAWKWPKQEEWNS